MDVSQYLDVFIDESKEHLQNLNTQILDLEQEPGNMDTINEIFRAAHTLKGMAGTMGYKRMQNLTHDMENVFSASTSISRTDSRRRSKGSSPWTRRIFGTPISCTGIRTPPASA